MDRRGFLKVLGAAGLVAVVPAAMVAAVAPVNPLLSGRIGHYEGIKFFRMGPEPFDFGHQFGLGAGFYVGEERYRHAIRLPTAAWKEFTPEQQEETWKRVERYTYDFAMKKVGGKP